MNDHSYRWLKRWTPIEGSYWAKSYPLSHTEWRHANEPRDTDPPATDKRQTYGDDFAEAMARALANGLAA